MEQHSGRESRQVRQPNISSDCYSAGERRGMELGQSLRAVLLRPLLGALTNLRISPDTITLLAGVAGLAFLPLWLSGYPVWALLGLFLHVCLDGLDGPLARHQRVASARGSFTDTFSDQFVVTIVTITWMLDHHHSTAIVAASLFIFLYALVVGMAMVRNALAIPYAWLIRPRFFLYSAIALDYMAAWRLTMITLVICDLLLALKCVSGFWALRKKIPGPHVAKDVPQDTIS